MYALEQNYRSTQPILAAANAVIALASERHAKELFSTRPGGQRPRLVTVADEIAEVDYVVGRILERRETGVPLRQQAVLFRAAHHSDMLEVELGRRNIPFVKYAACVSWRRPTSRTRWPSCAGRRTHGTRWPASGWHSPWPGGGPPQSLLARASRRRSVAGAVKDFRPSGWARRLILSRVLPPSAGGGLGPK